MEDILAAMSTAKGYKVQENFLVDSVPVLLEETSNIWNPNSEYTLVATQVSSIDNHPALELRRRLYLDKLKLFLKNTVLTMGLGELPNTVFENWLWCNSCIEKDPLLPGGTVDRSNFKQELIKAGASKRGAARLSEKMLSKANEANRLFSHEKIGLGKKSVKVLESETQFQLTYKSISLSINKEHYTKLEILYQRSMKRIDMLKARDFHKFLFCLLLRYDTIDGGGFQAALNEKVFDVLLEKMNCQMECFASPFNCRYGRYCSAFGDIDTAFGSVGSFFDFKPQQGCFEANPPFVPQLITRMAQHMTELLQHTSKELCFVIIIPAWVETEGWKLLKNGPFNRDYIEISQKDHGYLEGKQQIRPTRYRIASFDTSVFFWQNKAAMTKFPITDKLKTELRTAFESKQRIEREEKGLQQGGRNVKRLKIE